MRLLLDTNVLIWISDTKKTKNLGKQALRIISNSDRVYFSSLSIVEMQMKTMLNKHYKFSDVSPDELASSGLLELNLTSNHALAIANFPSLVRHDPFDRMLLAQAYAEGLILLTADRALLDMKLGYVVDATE